MVLNSGYWSDWSIKLLLLVIHQLNRDVTVFGSFPLKLFSFVLDVFESGHSTSYWGKQFGPLDPLDGRWYAWWNLSKWCFSVGIIAWPVDEDEIFKPREWRLSCPMGGGRQMDDISDCLMGRSHLLSKSIYLQNFWYNWIEEFNFLVSDRFPSWVKLSFNNWFCKRMKTIKAVRMMVLK